MGCEEGVEVGGEDGGELRADEVDAQGVVVGVEGGVELLTDGMQDENVGDAVLEDEGFADVGDGRHAIVGREAVDGTVE